MDSRKTVLDTIKLVRKNKFINISNKNQNIYRIVLDEENGEKTAYYFNSPLYRRTDGQLIDKRFSYHQDECLFQGSGANIKYKGDTFYMSDHIGELILNFNNTSELHNKSGTLYGENIEIQPTFNGISVTACCNESAPFGFSISTSENFENIKENSKYVAFMRNKFEPFFIISTLYAKISDTELLPCTITLSKKTQKTYDIVISAATEKPYTIVFEINLYEGKFFQDTTVESGSPDKNNCYGSVSFLGQTFELGEQWLYTKTSRKKVYDIENVSISSVRMFIPVFKKGNILPSAYLPYERFCSFGSTWKKKIPFTSMLTTAQYSEEYYVLDLSDLLINPSNKHLKKTEGIILRLAGQEEDCSIIATGDCCIAPQFLEVKYR